MKKIFTRREKLLSKEETRDMERDITKTCQQLDALTFDLLHNVQALTDQALQAAK